MCGAVQIAVAEPFAGALYCRRTRCQRRSGIRPTAHQFVANASPLEPLPDDGMPRFPERLGATDPL